ncbi:hypothetical protein F4826_001357 [Rahnella inusitata]|nr:hypothetical protein [Rahnella inusitata]
MRLPASKEHLFVLCKEVFLLSKIFKYFPPLPPSVE